MFLIGDYLLVYMLYCFFDVIGLLRWRLLMVIMILVNFEWIRGFIFIVEECLRFLDEGEEV